MQAFVKWHQAAHPDVPVTVTHLTRRNVTRWLADIQAAGASPGTARARYAAVKQFSKWLSREGETPGAVDSDDGRTPDPLAGMEAPRGGQRRVDALSPAELAALIKACRPPAGADERIRFEAARDEAAVRLLADAGLRAGEIAALKLTDVDLTLRTVTVTRAKGDKTRRAAFGADTAKALDRYLRRARRSHPAAMSPALWLGSQNRRTWGYSGIEKSLGRRAAAAGIPSFHLHRLRHTAASAMLREGASEGDVCKLFGWSNRAMLDVYTQDTAQERALDAAARIFEARGGGR